MSSCVDTPEGISLGQRRPNAWDGEKDIGVCKRSGEGSRIRLHRDEQTTSKRSVILQNSITRSTKFILCNYEEELD